jgi:mRNA-degrading endonuclease YafQ of YafQ-DinJ toxin-antitoxin module
MWSVFPLDSTLDKKLKKYKSNKPLIDNYFVFLEELKISEDPGTLGEPKCGQYKNCRGRHLTKSHSLIYSIDYKNHKIILIDLDDHKNLYGRD